MYITPNLVNKPPPLIKFPARPMECCVYLVHNDCPGHGILCITRALIQWILCKRQASQHPPIECCEKLVHNHCPGHVILCTVRALIIQGILCKIWCKSTSTHRILCETRAQPLSRPCNTMCNSCENDTKSCENHVKLNKNQVKSYQNHINHIKTY